MTRPREERIEDYLEQVGDPDQPDEHAGEYDFSISDDEDGVEATDEPRPATRMRLIDAIPQNVEHLVGEPVVALGGDFDGDMPSQAIGFANDDWGDGLVNSRENTLDDGHATVISVPPGEYRPDNPGPFGRWHDVNDPVREPDPEVQRLEFLNQGVDIGTGGGTAVYNTIQLHNGTSTFSGNIISGATTNQIVFDPNPYTYIQQARPKYKTVIIDDEFWSWGADEEGVKCYLTGKMTHYFHGFKDEEGNTVYVSSEVGEYILDILSKRRIRIKGKISFGEMGTIRASGTDFYYPEARSKYDWNEINFEYENEYYTLVDKRFYRAFYDPSEIPDYQPSPVDDDMHWLALAQPVTEKTDEVTRKQTGIESVSYRMEGHGNFFSWNLWGYNGIMKGDWVTVEGEEMCVVMVSRMGDFGLSFTGELPYVIRVSPAMVRKKGDSKNAAARGNDTEEISGKAVL